MIFLTKEREVKTTKKAGSDNKKEASKSPAVTKASATTAHDDDDDSETSKAGDIADASKYDNKKSNFDFDSLFRSKIFKTFLIHRT